MKEKSNVAFINFQYKPKKQDKMAGENEFPVNEPMDLESLTGSAPVADGEVTQESLAAQFNVPSNEKPNEGSGLNSSEFDAYIEAEIKAVNPDFALPQELKTMKKADGTPLTAKEAHDMRLKLILDNTEIETDDDEFIAEYRKAKANGVDQNSFLQQYNNQNRILNLPSKDFLGVYYKSMKTAEGTPRYSEDELNKFFESKSAIELDQIAGSIKEKIKGSIDFKVSADRVQQIDQQNRENAQIVNAYVEKLKTDQNFYGIELGEADKGEMLKSVGSMFTKDKRGISEFDRLMSDDNFVLQAAPILHLLKTGKLQTIITALKESVKGKTLDNLDPNPKNPDGSVASPAKVDPNDFD
jgi:hypothetical protein